VRIRFMTQGLPVFAAILFGFSLWSVLGAERSGALSEPPAQPPVNVYPAAVAGTGLVEPSSETVAVAVELGGVVSRVLVLPGQVVAAGEPLFAINDRQYAAVVEEAMAALRTLMFVVNPPSRQIPLPLSAAIETSPGVPAHRRKRSPSDDG
jgi:HlyD family secretion protein